MTSSDEDSSDSWVPLSQRAEWRDVQPVDLPFSLCPIVEIKYTAKMKEVLGYFRAIRAVKELSPRALELTQEARLSFVCVPHCGSFLT